MAQVFALYMGEGGKIDFDTIYNYGGERKYDEESK